MTGLVLEGGAMRGLFTAGVLDVFMENGIRFDNVIGVSAGACFGCNYVSGQIGRTIRYNMKYAKDRRYCSFSSLIKTGDLFGADFCYHRLPHELDKFDEEAFIASGIPFYLVVTDVETGEAGYHRMTDAGEEEMEWIRASSSMPLVSNIVEIAGGKYLDGGMTDAIPLKASEALGCKRNVTILTKPRGYRKSPEKTMPIIKWKYRDYPNLVHAMKIRHITYNEQLNHCFRQEKAGDNFVICPKSPLPLGHVCHDPLVMRETYEIGRNEANEMMPALERFMEIGENEKNQD
ncbi:MAG: patatin family protein [Lachnospiraceae bacterium]|nr:patatin family protein [Lachnospiraceae bacterium]